MNKPGRMQNQLQKDELRYKTDIKQFLSPNINPIKSLFKGKTVYEELQGPKVDQDTGEKL